MYPTLSMIVCLVLSILAMRNAVIISHAADGPEDFKVLMLNVVLAGVLFVGALFCSLVLAWGRRQEQNAQGNQSD